VGRAKFSWTPRSFGDIAVPAGFLHSPPVAQPALFGPSPILSRRSLHKLPLSLASAAPRTSSNSDVFVIGKHSRGEQKWTRFTLSTIAHTAMMDVWSKLAVARHGCLSVCCCGLLGSLCRRGFPTRSAFIATLVEFLAQTLSSKRRWGQQRGRPLPEVGPIIPASSTGIALPLPWPSKHGQRGFCRHGGRGRGGHNHEQ
jgi:hypothetical protein